MFGIILIMRNQFEEALHYFKTEIVEKAVNALNQKKTAEAIEINNQKRTHVQLADKLTHMTKLVDSCPGIIETIEKARFIVHNAPLGTRPAGQKILLKAITALESIAEQEPQIKRPLKTLKPLVYEYLGIDNHEDTH